MGRPTHEKFYPRTAAVTYVARCNLAHRLRVVMATTEPTMKKITFILSLVSLSLTVAASAAVQNDNQNDGNVYTLPAYRVASPRLTAAEKAIESSLAELRAQARHSLPVRTELPALGTVAQPTKADQGRSVAAKPVAPTQVRS